MSLLLSFSFKSTAQISFGFSPAMYGQNLEGLAFAQIINTIQVNIEIAVTIKVSEVSGADVLSIRTQPFWIRQGVSQIDRRAFSNGRFVFANNSLGTVVKQSGKLAEGEYEYCFDVEVLSSKGNVVPLANYEQCFIHNLQPLTPLLLINPVDGDELCNKRPDFIWQPPMPLPLNAKFRILLAEVKEKQDIVEAVAFNQPILNQANIRTNNLFYPANIPDLKEGHTYAWQVTVYVNQTILKKSEVWTFTVKCKEETKQADGESYRELKGSDDGNYYLANKYLRFSFNNPYNKGFVNYTIESISEPGTKIKGLPQLELNIGINKHELNFAENNSMKPGHEYLLKVNLPNRQLQLRFIYKNENAN
jgi:hypothetical protein